MNDIEKGLSEVARIEAEIVALNDTIADKLALLEAERSLATTQLEEAVMVFANDQLKDKDYGCGTANIDVGQAKIKVEVRKKVKWDEAYIQKNIEPLIKQAGRDPEEFIKYKRSVSEKDYKKFDDNMRSIFEPARTVEPSKPTITYERKV